MADNGGFVSVTRREGHYDLLHPQEVEASYHFTFPEACPLYPDSPGRSWTISLENDPNPSLDQPAADIVEELIRAYDERYLFSSQGMDLKKLLPWLQERALRDEPLRVQAKLDNLERRRLSILGEIELARQSLRYALQNLEEATAQEEAVTT